MESNFESTTAKHLVIDGRGMTPNEVRTKAQQLFGIETLQEDRGPNPGDHGFFLAGDPLHYYHMKSVQEGLFVVSREVMQPKQTRALAKQFLKQGT